MRPLSLPLIGAIHLALVPTFTQDASRAAVADDAVFRVKGALVSIRCFFGDVATVNQSRTS